MINPVIQVELRGAESGEKILTAGYLGDYPLLSTQWSLAQGTDASQCTLSLPGDDSALNDKLLSLKLYSPPPPVSSADGTGNSTGAIGGIGKSRLDQEKLIIEEAKRQGITNPKQIAYILATAQHESDQYNTLLEYHDGSDYEGRSDLGNRVRGDGTRYRGRGYVQITGRANYEKYSKITGKDLVGNPKLAEDQQTARFILVNGIKEGTFTGAKIGDYTAPSGNVDYVNARKTVNSLDEANKIAGYARAYETRLTTGDLSGSTPTEIQPTVTSGTSKLPEPIAVTPPPTEAGGQLIIRVGEFGGLIWEFLYLLSDVSLSISAGEGATLSLSGITPAWAVNQYKTTEARSNLTLKQLAKEIADSRGLELEFNGEGSSIEYLENNGLTRYQLLLRECARAGYTVWAEGTKLKCHPIAPTKNETGEIRYLIGLTEITNVKVSSKPGGVTSGNSGGLQGSWGREATIGTSTATGAIGQKGLPIKQAGTVENKPKQENLKDAKTTGMVAVVDQNGKPKEVSEIGMRAEVARVKDLPVTIDLIPSAQLMGIRPGNLAQVPTVIQYSATIAEADYWVDSIDWDYSSGNLAMSISAYKPGVEVPASQALSGGGGSATGSVSVTSAGWVHPYPGSTMTAPWGQQRGSRRHAGQDFSTGTNSPILSAADGQVTDVVSGCMVGDTGCGGQYGNLVDIVSTVGGKRYLHRYAHLTTVSVQIGAIVKARQQIGTSGNTGRSFGEHLHFEIRNPDQLYGFGGTLDPATFGIK